MKTVYNFSSGPAMLPIEVLQRVQKEFLDWQNRGLSVMEISHRSQEFIKMTEETEQDLRDLLKIPLYYKVLFCHGGARAQFSAIPGNLLGKLINPDYIDSGYWGKSSIKEAEKYCSPRILNVRMINNGKHSIIPMNEWDVSEKAPYLHFCPNETIEGILINEEPNFGDKVIVVGDFSSVILSAPINIKNYGLVYASAQKNIGPAGLTLVIIREDLLDRSHFHVPSILTYKVLAENNSMFNTPPTFAWYISGLVFKWLKEKGGLLEINKLNKEKADLLYRVIDDSDFYYNDIANFNRSRMNIPFRLRVSELNNLFLEESFKSGLYALKGHCFWNGMRASIYNAMSLNGVKALAEFMIYFERRYG